MPDAPRGQVPWERRARYSEDLDIAAYGKWWFVVDRETGHQLGPARASRWQAAAEADRRIGLGMYR